MINIDNLWIGLTLKSVFPVDILAILRKEDHTPSVVLSFELTMRSVGIEHFGAADFIRCLAWCLSKSFLGCNKPNHITGTYAPSADLVDKALTINSNMTRRLGIQVD